MPQSYEEQFREILNAENLPNRHLMYLEYKEENPGWPFLLKLSRHAPKDWIPILPKREFPFSTFEAAVEFAKTALNCYELKNAQH